MKTTISNITLQNPIFNASGPLCTTLQELENLGDSESCAIMMKSCTIEEREGNPSPRYINLDLGSINSMGLPNLGYKKYIEFAKKLKQKYDKPVVASIAGLKAEDFPVMVQAFQDEGCVDLIEVNLSCPNVVGKPQIAYDFEATGRILSSVCDLGNIPIGIKLPPYFDPVHSEAMANVIKKYNVSFITCINSVGNTLFIDPESEEVVIKPKGGFGGLGGDYVKPIALANVRKFYEILGDSVDIIGVGGIKSGIDVFEFILAGTKAVQLGTVFAKEDTSCFERINREFEEYMKSKGYSSVDEIRGKLKTL